MTSGYRAQVAGGATHAGQVFVLRAAVPVVNTDPVNWDYYGDSTAPTANDFDISGGTLQVKSSFTLNVPPGASVTLKVRGTVAASMAPGRASKTAGLAMDQHSGRQRRRAHRRRGIRRHAQ